MLAQGDREAETELILKTSRTEPRAGEKKTFWTWGSEWGVKVWVIWGSSFSRLHRRLATRTQTEAHKQTPATVHLAVPASLGANQAERDRNTPHHPPIGGGETDGRERKRPAAAAAGGDKSRRSVVTLSRDAAEPEGKQGGSSFGYEANRGPAFVCEAEFLLASLTAGDEGGGGGGGANEKKRKKKRLALGSVWFGGQI